MMDLIKDLKYECGVQDKYIQCDNARENEDFEQVCNQEGMGIEFEYNASTKFLFEWKFVINLNRV